MSIIRTIGFYQPFASLMLHGKIETRWIRANKKPPFPLGTYLFYSTQKSCDDNTLMDWCGKKIIDNINITLENDLTKKLNGYAIGMGELVKIEPLQEKEEEKSFVKYVGNKIEVVKNISIHKIQYGLYFENVQRIKPFIWKFGKQGIGFLPEQEISKISIE